MNFSFWGFLLVCRGTPDLVYCAFVHLFALFWLLQAFIMEKSPHPGTLQAKWEGFFSTDKSFNQGTFDHDKGQKSAFSGRRLHWIFLNFLQWIFFSFSPGFLCYLVRKPPQNVEKIARCPKKAQNPVTSLAVMVFSVLATLTAWYNPRIPRIAPKSIGEGATSRELGDGPGVPKMSLALVQPQGCTNATLGLH